MIPTKLAQKLLDAGWEQPVINKVQIEDQEVATSITLDDLIGACIMKDGADFGGIVKSGDEWIADGKVNNVVVFSDSCKTPGEAVANLWLKLNDTNA